MNDATLPKSFVDTDIPGVMCLKWQPTVGWSSTATDPASVVGKEIFAKVREKFSGSIEADAPDFVIYLMALDSAFAYIAELKRVYRILTAYTPENHYIPDALLRALGFTDAAILDLKQHRMQFFQCINELVFMTRKFNIPAVFDIMNRHYWMGDNVYMDSASPNSQFYVFSADGYFLMSEEEVSGIKQQVLNIAPKQIPTTQVTEYLFNYGRAMIDALAGSDDAYIISGYLTRAYEGTPIFTVDELPLDERFYPVYDPEVLMQIENANPVIFAYPFASGMTLANKIFQDPNTNAVLCAPSLSGAVNKQFTYIWETMGIRPEQFLSIRSEAPTVADVTIATRLKMGYRNVTKVGTDYLLEIVCGSEILTSIRVWSWMTIRRSTGVTRSLHEYELGGMNVYKAGGSMRQFLPLMLIQSFDWHPILAVYFQDSAEMTGDNDSVRATVTGDVHNLTLLSNEQLHQINRICLYSEFNAYGQI